MVAGAGPSKGQLLGQAKGQATQEFLICSHRSLLFSMTSRGCCTCWHGRNSAFYAVPDLVALQGKLCEKRFRQKVVLRLAWPAAMQEHSTGYLCKARHAAAGACSNRMVSCHLTAQGRLPGRCGGLNAPASSHVTAGRLGNTDVGAVLRLDQATQKKCPQQPVHTCGHTIS